MRKGRYYFYETNWCNIIIIKPIDGLAPIDLNWDSMHWQISGTWEFASFERILKGTTTFPGFKNSANLTRVSKNSYKNVLQEHERNSQDSFQDSQHSYQD